MTALLFINIYLMGAVISTTDEEQGLNFALDMVLHKYTVTKNYI